MPAESLALPDYHKGDAQTPTPTFPSFWLWCSTLWEGKSDNKSAARIKKEKEESPGALLVLVAHDDVFLIGTERWAQAARIRVEVYSVLWNVHQGRFQDLLYFHDCSDIVAFGLHLLHFSPDDWEKATESIVRSSRECRALPSCSWWPLGLVFCMVLYQKFSWTPATSLPPISSLHYFTLHQGGPGSSECLSMIWSGAMYQMDLCPV